MSAPPTSCPTDEVLEDVAAGRAPDAAVEAHLAECQACRDALERIRADNTFLRGFAIGGSFPRPPAGPRPIIEIPGYSIVRELHHGGQGVVYLAVQHATKREVAIKVMRQGPFATVADRARFEREIEALSKLEHPNIVTVHDAGVAAGFHYFVMNFVDGKPLDEAARDLLRVPDPASGSRRAAGARAAPGRAGLVELLRLFIKACDAVHAAHLQGVIHRDLKPSNICVDRRGEPHILDFGLSKAVGPRSGAAMTETGQFVGSLPWASPEQIEGAAGKIDLRTDVYSLGVILYQLLTGKLPFDVGSNLRHAVDEILFREPARPSIAAAETPASDGAVTLDDELDTVVLKCLAKDRARRYQSAGDLARDLRRYLAGEPIEAKRDSIVYMLRKTLRRYRFRVAVASIFVVLLGVFAGVMAVLYRHAAQLEREAVHSAEALSEMLTLSNIEQGRMAGVLGNMEQAEQLLWRELLVRRAATDRAPGRMHDPPGPPEPYWALWELYRRFPCLHSFAATPGVWQGAATADDGVGTWVAGSDGFVRLLGRTGDVIDSYRLDFPQARTLPIVAPTGDFALLHDGARFTLWSREGGLLAALPAGTGTALNTAAFSRDGRRLAALVDGAAVVWSTRPFAELARVTTDAAPLIATTLSSDGHLLAARDRAGSLHLWDVQTKQRVTTFSRPVPAFATQRTYGDLLFSPDDRWLADARVDTAGCIWDLRADPPLAVELAERPGEYRVQSFSPNGAYLAIGDLAGTLRVFDTATGQRRSVFVAHPGRIMSVAFTGDGRGVWTGGADGVLRLWEVEPDADVRSVRIAGEVFHAVAFSPDGRFVMAAGGLGRLHRLTLEGLAAETITFENTAEIPCVAIAPDGQRVAAGTYGQAVYVWKSLADNGAPVRLEQPGLVSYVCWSPDGTRLAAACDDRVVRVWRTTDWALERELREPRDRVPQVVFDPAGTHLAAAVRSGALLVWDLASGACETWSPASGRPARSLRYTPDGRYLLVAGADRTISIWGTASRQWEATLVGHNQEIFCLDVSDDGQLLASGDTGGAIRLWHLGLRRPLATLEGHSDAVMAVDFSPVGHVLASASLDGSVRLWELAHHVRHMVGNLETQLTRVGADEIDPRRAAAWRAWAREGLGGRASELGAQPAR